MAKLLRRLVGDKLNLIACALYLLLTFFAYTTAENLAFWAGFLLVVALFCFIFHVWRFQHIAHAPISTIAAAAQGHVELHGVATSPVGLKTPFHGVPCVWYRAWAYAQEGEQLWRLLSYEESNSPILLTDETGKCTIQPQGAEVLHQLKRSGYQNNHRYVEEYLPANQLLYVVGNLDTRHFFVSEQQMHAEVGQVLRDWRKNKTKLLNQYDTNLNRQIDADEWEKVRADARQTVEARAQNRAHLGDFEIAKPQDEQLFLLSSLPPNQLRQQHRLWAFFHASIALLVVLAV